MPTDRFFTQTNCDRCESQLVASHRTMSWFTEETLCVVCCEKETYLKNQLIKKQVDIRKLEGCGYIPSLV